MIRKSMTSRKLKAIATKQALYKSAITLFKEKGFENVHVEEIADRAGTSKGSFYTYFKSKDEVIIEHYQQIDEVYEEAFFNLNNTVSKLSLFEQIQVIFRAGLLFCDDLGYEFLSVVLINQLSLRETESFIMSKNRKLYKIIRNIIEEGRDSGDFNINETIEFQVDISLGFYRGLFLEYCLLKKPELRLSEFGEEFIKRFTIKMLQ